MNKNLFNQIILNLRDTRLKFIKLPSGIDYSYEDMITITGQYANTLKALGIKKNDRIILQTEKHLECIWLYLACLRVGCIFVALNPSYTVSETSYFVEDAKPKLFVTEELSIDGKLKKMLQQHSVEKKYSLIKDQDSGQSFKKLTLEASSKFEDCNCNGDEIAAILYTSGTTGRSKGAMISHNNLYSNALALSEIWEVSSKDTLMHILPVYHTHGLFVAFNTIMLANASTLFFQKFQVEKICENFQSATVLMGVPTHYIRLLNCQTLKRELVKNFRLCISGSAPLSAETHRKFKRKTGLSILERYGMTETNMITSNPYIGRRKPGTVGFPLPQVQVRIKDKNTGLILENGSVGMIEVKGPGIFEGYWQMPEKTSSEFQKDGFFITGDLGFIDSEGYLNIAGREKDLVISGGLNIYPAEIEKVLDALDGVQESAIVGLPHPDFGEGVTAFVSMEIGLKSNEPKLLNLMAKKLAKFKLPQQIIQVDQLPKNTMGKIQKSLLRERFFNLYLD